MKENDQQKTSLILDDRKLYGNDFKIREKMILDLEGSGRIITLNQGPVQIVRAEKPTSD